MVVRHETGQRHAPSSEGITQNPPDRVSVEIRAGVDMVGSCGVWSVPAKSCVCKFAFMARVQHRAPRERRQ